MRHLLLVIALSVCVSAPLLGVPVHAQTGNGQPGGTIAVESDANQDAAMAVRIREIIGQLDGYDGVSVSVADGIVTLRGTVLDAAQITALTELVARVEGVVAIENEVAESTDVRERLDPAIARIEGRIAQLAAVLPLILVAIGAGLLVVFAGFFIARRKWPWDSIAPNAFIADIYRQVVRLSFIMLGVVLALDLLNLTALLGTILGAAGIIGLAIGFAVRDTVENFIASIMLSIRQPFRPKDLVEIEGELGHVIRLTSRATILLSLDGNHIRLPNSTVFKAKIINYSRNDERRFTFALGIDPGADIARAQEIVLAALTELPFVLETPAPGVWVEGLGAVDHRPDGGGVDHAAPDLHRNGQGRGGARGQGASGRGRDRPAGADLSPDRRGRRILRGARPEDRARPPVAPPPERVEAQEIGADEQEAMESLIEVEREALPEDDLLRREAPQE
jgi:small conductance mechanosensitive channel